MLPTVNSPPCQTGRSLPRETGAVSSVSIPSVVIWPVSVFDRERPAAISIEIKSIDDTSNFDEFPESDILKPTGNPTGCHCSL
jgi:hypothetical protein